MLERDFLLVKKRGSRLCGSNNDEKKRASSMALTLGLLTGSVMLVIGVVEETG